MSNDQHSLLFSIASEYLLLNSRQKLNIGLKLGLVGVGVMVYSPAYIEELIFTNACKQNKIAQFVKAIEQVKHE